VLLADEPTGNLDDAYAREIVDLFRSFHQVGATVIVSTHDRAVQERLGGRTLTLADGGITDSAHG
jgi:cell division transport system ATP-binding protein